MMSAQNSKGFTLVELLIVVSIITVMTAAIIPNFSAYLNNQNVNQAVEILKSDLITLQNRALTGESSAEILANGKLATHWGVYIPANSANYSFFITDASDGTPSCAETTQTDLKIMGKSALLPGDTVTKNTSAKCIYFKYNTADVYAQQTVIVGPVGGASNSCKRLTVNKAGTVILETTNTACN